MNITVSWDITICSVGGLCKRIGETFSFQDSIFIEFLKPRYKTDKTKLHLYT
jgi:hypothetical protein